MKQILRYGGLTLIATVALTGCIDNEYNIDDIDTTSEFKVKDLVLPINLDVVTLGDIINIKEGDPIKELTSNGQTFYAVQESGTFSSDPINIPKFTSQAPRISPSVLNFSNGTRSESAARIASLTLPLKEPINRTVRYTADNIDPSIVEITDLFTPGLGISLQFTADHDISSIADVELSDIELQLPKGLQVERIIPEGNYQQDNGKLTISSVKLENNSANISLAASGIRLKDYYPGIDNHSLTLDAEINIESANLKITPKTLAISEIPSSLSLNIEYELSDLDVDAVSGEIEYKLEGDALNISPISLSDIPDFLAQEETNLTLANPQIYLSVNNPLAMDNLGFQTGLKLTALRENKPAKDFSLDKGFFTIGYDKGVEGPYNFCLSPKVPETETVPEVYAEPQHVAFTSLSEVISGNGIPSSIGIDLVDPMVYKQSVTRFKLGRDINSLEGNWEFIAPLAMKNGSGSKIIYTDIENGWNDNDVDAITIQKLEITTNITSTLPLNAHITGYPIDKYGNQISGVSIVGADIPAGATDYPVEIHITGEVKHLDGITFTATVEPGDNDEALSPNQTLTLKKVRVKVSGNYTKEL